MTAEGARLTISIVGDEKWSGVFQLPDTYATLQQGSYSNLTRYPFHDPAVGGLSWYGEARACNTLTGWIVIDSVSYDGADLAAIDLEFEQYCEGGAAALHGEVHWDADDSSEPPGPVVPPPADLWQPAAGVTPANGNYIFLASQPGDWVGGGGTYLYTGSDAVISVIATEGRLSVSIDGEDSWTGDFQAMSTLSELEVGYYGDLGRYPMHNPAKGGLNWLGEASSCNTLTGWFVVDEVTYNGSTLAAIDLRFELVCEGSASALHGKIHWDVNDTTTPPGPVVPPPADLWRPAAGVTPASGNYVYLESEPGDFIGAGDNYLYTLADSDIATGTSGAYFVISVFGDEVWTGYFQGMNSLSRLEVGYYGELERYPYHNRVKGGLSWGGNGRVCDTLTGWFVVDSVTYDGTALNAIDLRFEQLCNGSSSALRGKIHWDVNDTATSPGLVVPPQDTSISLHSARQ